MDPFFWMALATTVTLAIVVPLTIVLALITTVALTITMPLTIVLALLEALTVPVELIPGHKHACFQAR